jgi:hypothetical protein
MMRGAPGFECGPNEVQRTRHVGVVVTERFAHRLGHRTDRREVENGQRPVGPDERPERAVVAEVPMISSLSPTASRCPS